MVQFEYDGVMKRYNVKVPFTLAGESSMVTIASISEDNRVTLHRELSIKLLQQVLLSWAEHEHMETMKAEREAGEFDRYFDDETKNKNLEKSVDEMELSVRTDNCLQSKGIRTIGMLVENKPSDLFRIKNFGRRSLTEVEEKLMELGLTLKQ